MNFARLKTSAWGSTQQGRYRRLSGRLMILVQMPLLRAYAPSPAPLASLFVADYECARR